MTGEEREGWCWCCNRECAGYHPWRGPTIQARFVESAVTLKEESEMKWRRVKKAVLVTDAWRRYDEARDAMYEAESAMGVA